MAFVPLSPARLHHLPISVAYGATDIGPVRARNEDNVLIDEALGLAMVADGMGGHAAGDVASAGALTSLRAYLVRHAAADQRAKQNRGQVCQSVIFELFYYLKVPN